MSLQFIRDRATGWIAWIIVILITIPFALWGIHEYVGGGHEASVAEINGEEIGYREFYQAYQARRMQLRRILGGNVDPSLLNSPALRAETLDQLVDERLLLQVGQTSGLRVGEQQLATAIQSQDQFLDDGVFSGDRYDLWLRTQGLSRSGFEQDFAHSILREQLYTGLAASALVTEHDLNTQFRLSEQARSFTSLTIARASVLEQAGETVTEEAVAARYEQNKEQYTAPPRVRLQYLELSRAGLSDDVELDEELIQARYDESKEDFKTTDQREANHILIRLELDASEEEAKAAEQTLLDLKAQIENGESFAELAKAHSQDPGSANQGGSLGRFARGIMDPAFEKAAFALDKGEISDPVRSGFGLHLIEVTGVHDAVVKPFEEVRATLEDEYRRDQAEEVFAEQLDLLANLAFEESQSLEPAAEELGLEIQESGWMTRGLDGVEDSAIGRYPAVRNAAFEPEVLEDGNNSEIVEIDPERITVLRVFEHEAARQREFDEVRDQIREALTDEAARREVRNVARTQLEGLRGGELTPEAISEALDTKWVEHNARRRNATSVGAAILKRVFRMPHPEAEQVTYGSVVTADGDVVLLVLNAIEEGKVNAKDGSSSDLARNRLSGTLAREEFQAWLDTVRAEADVRTYVENLDEL